MLKPGWGTEHPPPPPAQGPAFSWRMFLTRHMCLLFKTHRDLVEYALHFASPTDLFNPHLRTFLSLLLEREEGRERETAARERSIHQLPPVRVWTGALGPGIEAATQACAPSRKQTCSLSVTGRRSNQRSHPSQADSLCILNVTLRGYVFRGAMGVHTVPTLLQLSE